MLRSGQRRSRRSRAGDSRTDFSRSSSRPTSTTGPTSTTARRRSGTSAISRQRTEDCGLRTEAESVSMSDSQAGGAGVLSPRSSVLGRGESTRLLEHATFAYVAVAILAALIFLFHLGSPPLTSPNEGLYAEVAREMNATGEFVIPHANGVVYLEKPPLLYWLTALSMRVFGETAFGARLPSALAAIATVLVVCAAGRRLFGPLAGMLSGIVLATSLGVALVARQVLFDSLLTLWTTIALLGFWMGTEETGERRSSRRIWLLAG